jgi:hypothetical protein
MPPNCLPTYVLINTRAPSVSTSPSKSLILFNLTVSLVLTVSWIVVLVALVRKKRWYPREFTRLTALQGVGAFISSSGHFLLDMLFFMWTLIWVKYLPKSVRVKNTFGGDWAAAVARVSPLYALPESKHAPHADAGGPSEDTDGPIGR